MDERISKTLAQSNRADMREAILRQRRRAEKGREGGERYGLDRTIARQYLSFHPEWRKKVEKYLRQLQNGKQPVVYVDICGRATGQSLGADLSYTFSLQPKGRYFTFKGETHVEGDIFNGGDFGRFLRVIVENGHRPAFVTFVPVAGLQKYIPTEITEIPASADAELANRRRERYAETPRLEWDVTWQRLKNNLERMIGILRPGGYIYLTKPFQLLDMGEFLRRVPKTKGRLAFGVQAICQELGCAVEVVAALDGPAFLIKKPGRKRAPGRP